MNCWLIQLYILIMATNIIFTVYFAMTPNPQGKNWKKNDIKFIQPLYDSVKRLGLDMIIFHDHLNERFINKYTTDKIHFEGYKQTHNIPTMSRFYCYLEHLTVNKYSKILCLDCGDLELFKDPFPLIENRILIGSEGGKIRDSQWMYDVFRKAYGQTYYGNKQVLNCGIIGGTFYKIRSLLLDFKLDSFRKTSNVDMAVFNKLIYDLFEFETGYPIHTRFNKFEGPESGCYIRHK